MDHLSQALVLCRADGTISYANRTFGRATGIASAVGSPLSMFRDRAEDPSAFDAMFAAVRRGTTWQGEIRTRGRENGGGRRVWRLEAIPLDDEDGRVPGFFVFGEDVSSQRALEAQFRQAQKMEAVARLAGGIVHDFNNILMVIQGHADLLTAIETTAPEVRASARAIEDASDRAARLTRQLLAFSREKPAAAHRIDVNDIVRRIEPMVRSLVGEDIEVLVATARDDAPVIADASQIEQIVMNLAVNARDAMPSGGALTIETLRLAFRSAHTVRQGLLPAGDYVLLAVSDTGQGIPYAIQERIFEPFYTTKETGKGTGLGLSTVYGIATQHGGQVEVYSEPGEGTTFKVYLPCTDSCSDAVRDDEEARAVAGTETVLLVEDDDDVRGLLRDALRRYGYRVIESRNGDEALLFSQRYAADIDLLMTDLIMPGMNGAEIADAVAAQRPGIRTLFMSGYADHAVMQHATIDDRTFIRKPFSTDAAVARVRRALDEPPSRRSSATVDDAGGASRIPPIAPTGTVG
ncbi:MAG: response regulator [Acidobacteria bacterium]|nr:response regulator [Acidobacteriota bacterium]